MLTVRHVVTDADKQACFAIRYVVFTEGQGVPTERDRDGQDDAALHFLAAWNDEPVATLRLRLLEGGVAKLERMAVLERMRGMGVGKAFLAEVLAQLKANPAVRTVKLSSQSHAIPFYEKLGFEAYGDEFLDADIPHRMMRVAS